MKKVVGAIAILFTIAFFGHVYASEKGILIWGNDRGEIEGIEQGPTIKDFAANIPIASIWIDESKINTTMNSRNKCDETDPNCFLRGGLTAEAKAKYPNVFLEGISVAEGAGGPNEKPLGNNFVALNLRNVDMSTEKAPSATAKDHLKYSGPIAEFVYKGAAMDSSGKELDVYITYSDLRVNFRTDMTLDNWKSMKQNMAVSLWSGNMAEMNGMKLNEAGDGVVNQNFGNNSSRRQIVGVVWDTKVQIKDPKTGKAVDGTFYAPMVDIDVKRTWDKLNLAADHNNFSEQLFLYQKSIDKSSKIYIPGSDTEKEVDYGTEIVREDDGWIFKPIKDVGKILREKGWDETFYTGFLTLINNKQGLEMENQFAGGGDNAVSTYFMTGSSKTDYRLKSSTTTYDSSGQRIGGLNDGGDEGVVGGRVQTTKLGNKNGNLLDHGEVINEATIATATGQKIKYTLTPKPGYILKKVIINKGSLNYQDETGTVVVKSGAGTNPEITNTKLEIEPQVVTNANGSPRYYTFEFWDNEGIDQDNSIHVDWEPTNLKITKNVEQNEHKIDDTFKFQMKVWDPNTTVKASKKVDNPITTCRNLKLVDTPEVGKTYYLYDDNGHLMGWNGSSWDRLDFDPDDTAVDPGSLPSDEFKFVYQAANNIQTLDGKKILQRKSDYALVVGNAGSSEYRDFVPSSNDHAIEWKHGLNDHEGGATPEHPIEYDYEENLYGIVNGGDKKVKFYEYVEKENCRKYPVITRTEKVVKTHLKHVLEPEAGETYVMGDGKGNYLTWLPNSITNPNTNNGKFQLTPVESVTDAEAFMNDPKNLYTISEIENSETGGKYERILWNGASTNNSLLFSDPTITGANYLNVGEPLVNGYYVLRGYGIKHLGNGIYDVLANPVGEYHPLEFYELVTEEVEEIREEDFSYIYYDFIKNPIDGYKSSLEGDNTYILNEDTKEGAPNFDYLTEDGWKVEIKGQYDIGKELAKKGFTKVSDKANTYEFSLTTQNFTKELKLTGIIPKGWKYEISEVENTMIGTKGGWKKKSQSDNTTNANFDGDESVEFVNEREMKEIILEKTWVDNNDALRLRPENLSGYIIYRLGDDETKLETDSSWTKTDNVWTYKFMVPKDTTIVDYGETEVYRYDLEKKGLKEVDNPSGTETYQMFNTLWDANNLTIKKSVQGDAADKNKKFKITVKIMNTDGELVIGNFKAVINGEEQVLEGTNAGIIFNVKHNDVVEIKDIRKGYSYVVEEENTNYDEYYEVKDSSGKTVQTKAKGFITEGNIDADYIVEFTNKLEKEIIPDADVPNTGDNIHKTLLMLLISLVGSMIGLIYFNKNKFIKQVIRDY